MANSKVLITGSNGLLGQKLVDLFVNNKFNVVATSKGDNRNPLKDNYKYVNVNITNFNAIYKLIKKVKPNFIIHAAAMTNVDACELRQRECKEVNAVAVKKIAKFCTEFDIHLIHISTDFIFEGKKGYYLETDKAKPVNYYGKTKLKAENHILKYTDKYTILRTIILYGLIKDSNRSNFVLWVKESLENNKSITIVTDQYRMPTYVNYLAEACLKAVRKEAIGIYHISSNTLLSVYEMALEIANVFNLDKTLIKPILTEQLNQKAERPKKTGFIIDKAVKDLSLKSVSFKEQLLLFKKELDLK